jgi:hypothetical protein
MIFNFNVTSFDINTFNSFSKKRRRERRERKYGEREGSGRVEAMHGQHFFIHVYAYVCLPDAGSYGMPFYYY